MSILAKLLRNAGVDPAREPASSRAGRFYRGNGVDAGPEFERIAALPRRDPFKAPDLDQLVSALSAAYRTREFNADGDENKLFPVQALALRELHDERKLCVFAALGVGKTLITALAPVVLEAKRPLFVVYARLMKKTKSEFSQLANDWNICQNYRFENLEKLVNSSVFEEYQPDLVVCDESAGVRPNSGRSKRLWQYLESHDCVFLPLTGTPGDDKVEDVAWLQYLSLRSGSPYPTEDNELAQWGQALNAQVTRRREPGALVKFTNGSTKLDDVRRGVGERAYETPGNVFSFTSSAVGCSLLVNSIKLEGLKPETDDLFAYVAQNDSLPDGRVFEDAFYLNMVLKQLALGFSKVLDPAPPEEWRDVRREWATFARSYLDEDDNSMCTPSQVVHAIRRGDIDDGGVYESWLKIRPTFEPRHVTVWHDTAVLELTKNWLAKNKDSLVWTSFPILGYALEKYCAVPFFRAQGVSAASGSIEDWRGRSAILAVKPNSHGRNLQRYSRNLFLTPLSKADDFSQACGRTHRRGQTSDIVDVSLLLSCRESWNDVAKSRARAKLDRSMNLNHDNKVLACDWTVADLNEVNTWTGPRWESR